jgi:phosphopantothenoylcysteine decarboxylase / phosphopantothenate---cysteine ligase
MRPAPFYLRNPSVVAVARQSSYSFFRPDRDLLVISEIDAEAMSALLSRLVLPVAAEALEELVSAELLAFLLEEGILLVGDEAELRERLAERVPRPGERPCRHLVVGVSGAIGASQVVPALVDLHYGFCQRLDVILTPAAQNLVHPRALEYFGIQTWTDTFETRGEVNVPHMHLAQSAELVLVYPASAHTLYKLAHGACSDLLSLVIAATRAPVVLVPAMNQAMWESPAIARNVARLREDGLYVVQPGVGYEVAKKKAAEPELGGAGVRGYELGNLLAAILTAHRAPEGLL